MHFLIVGDTHGKMFHLRQKMKASACRAVIQVGDFGYWPDTLKDISKGFEKPTYFIDGNHEQLPALLCYKESQVLAPNLTYMPRFSTLTTDLGNVIMFIGGGNSIDKRVRQIGIDWFPEEVVEVVPKGLPDKVDVVISHTCPLIIEEDMLELTDGSRQVDPTTWVLDRIRLMYHPKLWFFGHWHRRVKLEREGCVYTCLNKATDEGYFTEVNL